MNGCVCGCAWRMRKGRMRGRDYDGKIERTTRDRAVLCPVWFSALQRVGKALRKETGGVKGLVQRVAGGSYLQQHGAGADELVIAVVQHRNGPHEGRIVGAEVLLNGHGQLQILLPAVVGVAHNKTHLGGVGLLGADQLVLVAVGVGDGVPVDIQHEHQRGVFLHVILHGSQTVGVGVVVVRHVVKGAVVEDGNATLRQGGGDLVIYSPNSEGLLNATIPLFEEKYGVNVELIQAGTGELVKRIQSEKNDPYADVLFGGSWSLMYTNEDLWEPYVSANDANVIDAYKNKCGFITGNVLDGSVLIVNTDLIGDIKIEGYEDLLNPALKGKIATADPANSSSAFAHLTNMLLAMGGYEDDKAWQYVHDLFENVDGKICESSSGVYKGVADGEYVVGLSYEDPCAQLVLDGAPVKIVYMKEGTVFLPASATIIKGAKNMDNAKLFIDFILSEEVQNIWGSTLTNRPVMKDAATNDAMTPMADINVIEEDIPYVSAHKSELVDKYTEIFTDLQSK